MNKFKRIVVAVVFAIGMVNMSYSFEAGQSVDLVKQEIHQKLNSGVSVTKVYQNAIQTGVSKQFIASMIMMESRDVKQAIESLFLTDLSPKTVFSIATSLGIKSDVVLAAALNSGISIDSLLESTAAGDRGDSGFSVSRAGGSFGATPASSFNGGGGGAASRN